MTGTPKGGTGVVRKGANEAQPNWYKAASIPWWNVNTAIAAATKPRKARIGAVCMTMLPWSARFRLARRLILPHHLASIGIPSIGHARLVHGARSSSSPRRRGPRPLTGSPPSRGRPQRERMTTEGVAYPSTDAVISSQALTRNPVRFSCHFHRHGGKPGQPGHDGKAGFIQGGSAAGRPELSAIPDCPAGTDWRRLLVLQVRRRSGAAVASLRSARAAFAAAIRRQAVGADVRDAVALGIGAAARGCQVR